MSELNPRAGGMEVGKDEGVTLHPAEKQSEGGWDHHVAKGSGSSAET